jgi:hypothetical protein
MAVLKPRTRIVYCRLSVDEFSQINQLCERGLARSTSELVRRAVMRFLEGSRTTDPGTELSSQIRTLTRMIGDLNETIRSVQTGSPPGSHDNTPLGSIDEPMAKP